MPMNQDPPTVVIGTLALNEMEWLPRLYEQHKDWPGLKQWVIVEAADEVYARTNPKMVTREGLSVDGTTEFLEDLDRRDGRILHIKHGMTRHEDPAQGKCAARSRYLEVADEQRPTFVVVLDADEFYPREYQPRILNMATPFNSKDAFVFKHRDVWRPKSIQHLPLFSHEVRGGFWAIPYCRLWRWREGMRYVLNHNSPEVGGRGMDKRMMRFDDDPLSPEFVHMAFASSRVNRAAKHRYYEARGEGRTDHRRWYVDSRAAFETWRPGKGLPRGAEVFPYSGIIPECFREEGE